MARVRMQRERALAMGGSERVAKQHAQGKLTARERLEYLLDPGSFIESDMHALSQGTSRVIPQEPYPGDGVITGFGTIHGREVAVYAQDFTVNGGSLGAMCARKICKIMDQALQTGVPMIGLNDSGGARIQEGVASLAGYGEIFHRNVAASGVIPQIAAIMGPCAGGAVYSPAVMDFIFMVRNTSNMFLTGPDVIKTVLNENTTAEDLGGATVHAEKSGVCHLVGENETEVLDMIRELVTFLPQNNVDPAPRRLTQDPWDRQAPSLNTAVPENPSVPYDMKAIIEAVVDDGRFFEVMPDYAKSMVVGFGRMEGNPVGIIANNPMVMAGVLDATSSEKAARFIRFCDAFNLPIISFVDVPGFMPGTDQEHGGIIRRGAKLLYAYCEATVPKLTVITRKAYGGAYIVMSSKHLRTDVNLAWPTAEIAVMGAEGAVNVLYRRQLSAAQDPAAMRKRLEAEYRAKFGDPFYAAELGYVDDVIEPAATRQHIIRHLRRLRTKREDRPGKKHGNMPV
ncbi:MAG TPA: acyl-CoA carboxylase subunit beta [Candidatus Thermoplasmatota archaeon]|nr:acyl-CoA carboxylase subunit beta [Candidatus Thermoplasmatota archaeon]